MFVHLCIYNDQSLINNSVKVTLQQVLKYKKDNGLPWSGR